MDKDRLDLAHDKPLRVSTVAEWLDCSEKTVYRLINEAQFRSCSVRGSVRVWKSSVEDYLQRKTEHRDMENGYFKK